MKNINASGLKMTPQRVAILEYLHGNTDHPSAEDIYREIGKKYPMMSFATVYKTIETLKNRGELLELTIDPARRRYDPDTRHHHHLICVECKKIVDIYEDFQISVPEDHACSFEMIGNHIEFYGMCPECKKRKEPDLWENSPVTSAEQQKREGANRNSVLPAVNKTL
ncbi:MAG: transcriptional repressor [Nitrospiraceae bacterium]|nr:MAG: transcriptional repressor [Nitrospiraceae bacterium]